MLEIEIANQVRSAFENPAQWVAGSVTTMAMVALLVLTRRVVFRKRPLSPEAEGIIRHLEKCVGGYKSVTQINNHPAIEVDGMVKVNRRADRAPVLWGDHVNWTVDVNGIDVTGFLSMRDLKAVVDAVHRVHRETAEQKARAELARARARIGV